MNASVEIVDQAVTAAQSIADPFAVKSTAEYLALAKMNDPICFTALWLRASTGLTLGELKALRWEYIFDRGDTWLIEGPIGVREKIVKTTVAGRGVAELSVFRRPSGPVLFGRAWENGVTYLQSFAQLPDLDVLRTHLAVAPVIRKPKRPARKRVEPVPESESQPTPGIVPEPCVAALPARPVELMPADSAAIPQTAPRIIPFAPIKPKPLKQTSDKQYATVAEVAELLCRCDRWVKDQAKAGNLRGYRVGSKCLIEMASVREFLDQREMTLSSQGVVKMKGSL